MTNRIDSDVAERQRWLSALAKADWSSLADFWQREEPKPAYDFLRPPDTGLVMLRGRMGGSGAPFNVGEATVTRCSVTVNGTLNGHAYVLGRNRKHAEVAAVYDALLQDPAHHRRLSTDLIASLEAEQDDARRAKAAKAAASKVEFFTMVRGED